MISEEIRPIGYFKVCGDEILLNMNFISENQIIFTGREGNLINVEIPDIKDIVAYRNSDP